MFYVWGSLFHWMLTTVHFAICVWCEPDCKYSCAYGIYCEIFKRQHNQTYRETYVEN